MMDKKQVEEISKKINMPEEKIEEVIKDTLNAISKPSLDNIDCPQHYEIGVGSSEKD